MKSIYRWVGVISVLALSAALGPACAPDASGGGSGIAGEDDIAAASKTGGGLVIVRLYEDAIRTRGIIDEAEAVRLSAFLKGTEQDDARRVLQSIVDDASAALAPEARAVLKSALAGEVKGDVPLDNPIYRVELGSNPAFVLDDQLFLRSDGTVASRTGITGHSRGYAKRADGVLLRAHGSPFPVQNPIAGSAAEPPAQALDAAAATFGLKLAYPFSAIAKNTYDPKALYWEGICHAWTYSSLDERLNQLVDVEGPSGNRGLWIFGHWISRADLGNWLMGVANTLSIADAVLLDSFVTPDDLVKGIAEYVMTSRRGLRADIFNDTEQGRFEVWNQPIVSATMNVESVPASVRDAVLSYARSTDTARKLPPLTDVKLVRLTAKYGAEASDAHEDDVVLGDLNWNMYLATESNGRVAVGYMAHLLANRVQGLSETRSDALPDYFARPKHELIDQALAGKRSMLLDGSQDGPAFRFFVGTVLARGIPDATRLAFEQQASRATSADVPRLRRAFPGIANAYTPEQWRSRFEARLGPGKDFGAVWSMASAEFLPNQLAAR